MSDLFKTSKTPSPPFDFDDWASLARTNPQAFERHRRNYVEGVIAAGMFSQRLRGLQCRIDMERQRARTPLKACLRISSMMWEKFHDLNEILNDPVWDNFARGRRLDQRIVPIHAVAVILPFHRQN